MQVFGVLRGGAVTVPDGAQVLVNVSANGSPSTNTSEPSSVTTPNGVLTVSGSFTRPADTSAYLQYDLIADSTSAATPLALANAVRNAGDHIRIDRIRVRSSAAAAKGKQVRVHLFRTAPTLGVNDNGIFNATGADTLAVSDIVGWVGSFDVTLDKAGAAGASGQGVPSIGNSVSTSPSSGTSLYAVLELRSVAGYTPTSGETFGVTLEGVWS